MPQHSTPSWTPEITEDLKLFISDNQETLKTLKGWKTWIWDQYNSKGKTLKELGYTRKRLDDKLGNMCRTANMADLYNGSRFVRVYKVLNLFLNLEKRNCCRPQKARLRFCCI
jgi:hypothetical protein